MVLSAEERRRVNQQNARNSSGPKTVAGKNRSRLNPLTHGLAAKSRAALGDHAPVLSALLAAWIDVYRPASPADHELIEQAVVAAIQRQRSIAAVHRRLRDQLAATDPVAALLGDDEVQLYRRYEHMHTLALRRALGALLRRRAEAAAAAQDGSDVPASVAGEVERHGYY